MARDRIAPIYMYGPIGSGKTSILRRLSERLGADKSYNVAYVITPNVRRANTFLKVVMDAFDLASVRDYDANLKVFEAFLVGQYQKGSTPVLLLDEAQNAPTVTPSGCFTISSTSRPRPPSSCRSCSLARRNSPPRSCATESLPPACSPLRSTPCPARTWPR